MPPLLHRLRSKSSFHSSSSSSPSSSSSSRSSGTDQSPDTKTFPRNRKVTNPISILVETDVVTECYRCGPGRGHAHGEKCCSDNVMIIGHSSRDRSSPLTERRNVGLTKSPLRNVASQSYLQGATETKRHQHKFGPALQDEFQKLSESRTKLESEVKEHTDFLRFVQGKREKLVAEGQNLRHFVSPEAEFQDKLQFVNLLGFIVVVRDF